jgi:hypothetical protein
MRDEACAPVACPGAPQRQQPQQQQQQQYGGAGIAVGLTPAQQQAQQHAQQQLAAAAAMQQAAALQQLLAAAPLGYAPAPLAPAGYGASFGGQWVWNLPQWAPATSMALFVPGALGGPLQYAGQQAPDSAMPAGSNQARRAKP